MIENNSQTNFRLSKQKYNRELAQLQQLTKGSPDVCVVVIDGPIDEKHPSFSNRKIDKISSMSSYGGVATSHGTHVASVIVGKPVDGFSGVAPGCSLLSVPVFSETDRGILERASQKNLEAALNAAYQYKIDHPEKRLLVNLSGGQLSQEGEPDPGLLKAIKQFNEHDIPIISAVGNNGCSCLHVPAAHQSILAVGALDDAGYPMAFSNWGADYKDHGLMAPGYLIKGAKAGTRGYASQTGTSFATPLVTGVFALLMSYYPKLAAADVKNALLQAATPCPLEDGQTPECDKLLTGSLNIGKTLELLGHMAKSSKAPVQSNLLTGLSSAKADQSNKTILKPLNTFNMNETTNEAVMPSEELGSSEMTMSGAEAVPESADSGSGITPSLESDHAPAAPAAAVQPSVTEPAAEASVVPSQTEGVTPSCGCSGGSNQLVFALGSLGIDYENDAVLDSFKFYMVGIKDEEGNDIEYPNPNDPYQLLAYLNGQKGGVSPSPFDSARVLWTVKQDNTPIYVIRPSKEFSEETYRLLRNFLDASRFKSDPDSAVRIDMISVPGRIVGQQRLFSGQVVPVIEPNMRAMYNWRAIDLASAVGSEVADDNATQVIEDAKKFVNKVYFQLQNLGITSADRALNYAATNIYNVVQAIKTEIANGFTLKSISAQKSNICRPGSDCQDVIIRFFNPKKRFETATNVYRFTIDVSRVIPVAIGEPRTWFEH